MDLLIRKEKVSDYPAVAALIERAFLTEAMSDHREHILVDRLRQTPGFVPELSLVAEVNHTVVGHILLTEILIKGTTHESQSLALAPVSVLPAWQGRGIGSKLIEAAHERARQLGYASVLLLGHATYYPRFGYQPATTFGIELPFPAPPENCLALELRPGGLANSGGAACYPPVFFGEDSSAKD